jgi:transcriptional regulator with XRE-family HTH domain
MDILKVFGDNLRKYRMLKGFTQEEFAFKCGLHRTYISQIERKIKSPSIDTVEKIANALEIEVYKFFI